MEKIDDSVMATHVTQSHTTTASRTLCHHSIDELVSKLSTVVLLLPDKVTYAFLLYLKRRNFLCQVYIADKVNSSSFG